ncbi:MAG: hypothetical protein NEHIOOID_01044 [Holosporales bacterium]
MHIFKYYFNSNIKEFFIKMKRIKTIYFFIIIFTFISIALLNYKSFIKNTSLDLKIFSYFLKKKPTLISERFALNLYQVMKDVHEVFELAELPYWIDGGTLLGSIRHHGIIPWDDDLDITISHEHEDLFVEKIVPALEKLGYKIINAGSSYKIVLFKGLFDEKISPSCDVFIAREKNGRMILDGGWEVSIKKEDLYPLKKYQFGKFELYGPNVPENYLNDLYGKNWSKMADQGHYHSEGESKKRPFILEKENFKPAMPLGPLKDRVTKDIL